MNTHNSSVDDDDEILHLFSRCLDYGLMHRRFKVCVKAEAPNKAVYPAKLFSSG